MASLFSHALLVEDEVQLATALRIALQKLGIRAELATTLADAKLRLTELDFDFILLDRNLPDGEGLDLCSSLRKAGYTGSILVLTAQGQTEDRVQGLNVGADDYLPKPFSWEELEARIRALARRKISYIATPSDEGSPARWALDAKRLRIYGHEGWVELTPLEFKLANRLMSHPGTIVTRDDLLKDVWGFTLLPKTRTVDHFLGRLRKLFELDAEDPRHFLTVRGAGYRFEP